MAHDSETELTFPDPTPAQAEAIRQWAETERQPSQLDRIEARLALLHRHAVAQSEAVLVVQRALDAILAALAEDEEPEDTRDLDGNPSHPDRDPLQPL